MTDEWGFVGELQEKKKGFFQKISRIKRNVTSLNLSATYENPVAGMSTYKREFGDEYVDQLCREGGHQTPQSIREGLAALEAQSKGLVEGPLTRGDLGQIDFYDAKGRPFDIKTPKPNQDLDTFVKAVVHELGTGQQSKDGNESYSAHVVIDTTYLSNKEHAELWTKLNDRIKKGKNRILEVHIPFYPGTAGWTIADRSK
jgi:hypothetical protein